eukprot:14270196-Ditylum_brightwellii.AAC.1
MPTSLMLCPMVSNMKEVPNIAGCAHVNGIRNPKWGFQGRARNPEISRAVTRMESGIRNL